MKGLLSVASVLTLVALACGDATVDTAGGADPPHATAATTTTSPATTAPFTTAAPPPDGTVRVAITGTLTTGPDALVEVCKPGELDGCFGVEVVGDLGDAVAGGPGAHRLVGDYDGRRITLAEPPQPAPVPGLEPPDFSTPCEGLTGSRDEAVITAAQEYAASVPDSYAGSWVDNAAGVFTLWFTGDDVSQHEAAIAAASGGAPVCVVGGAEYTDAELRAAQDAVVDAVAGAMGMSFASGDVLRNRVVVDAEHVDRALLEQVAGIHPGIEVIAYIEVLDGAVADLPPPVPVRPGDVALVTGTSRARGGMDALGFFTLRFDPDLGCFYFEGDEGRVLPIWPLGFSATSGPPAQVFDRDGEVFATDGDPVEVGGGSGGSRSEEACGTTNVWVLNI